MAKDLPKFPTPAVENLRKATLEQLINEIIELRKFAGQLYMAWKNEQSETGVDALNARMNTLEEQGLRYALTKDVHIAIEGLRKDLTGLDGAINGARARLSQLEQWKRELEHTLKEGEETHDPNTAE